MKTLKIVLFSFVLILLAHVGFAQVKSAAFKVAGECGMCKKKIETTAKQAGATYAVWNESTKELSVKYKATSSNPAKIQQAIAGVGYDTPGFKATDEAYEKLHECCKYERSAAKDSCCDGASCTKEECKKCCADGKCSTDKSCCKDGKCEAKHEGAHHSSGMTAACCKKA